jgi:hypothetical protein
MAGGGKIENGEAAMAKRYSSSLIIPDAEVVRTPVGQALCGEPQKFQLICVKPSFSYESGESAHVVKLVFLNY